MFAPFLHTTSGAYDRAEIMRRSWVRARNTVARQAKADQPVSIRTAFAGALHLTWDEAKGARANAAWRAEQDRQAAALATLDTRTREIAALRFARVAADGIESGTAFRREVRAIETRLATLNA